MSLGAGDHSFHAGSFGFRWRIGRLHSVLPSMISEVEAAACELKDLDELEAWPSLAGERRGCQARLDEKKKARHHTGP